MYRDVRDSIFRVSLTPSDVEAHEDELADLAEDADTVENEAELAELLIGTMISTGFAAGVYDGEIAIVTVAHSLEHLFRASRPITTDQINRLFTVQVLCGHYENDYLEAGGDLDAPRQYAAARVVRIGCTRDLMLVAANLIDVLSFEGGPCLAPHPIMGMCEGDFDPHTSECLMVSWPRYKPDTMSVTALAKLGEEMK